MLHSISGWLRFTGRLALVVVLIIVLLLMLDTSNRVQSAMAAPASSTSVTIPTMKLPWDKSLTNIAFTGGPHSGKSQTSCVLESLSSLSGVDFGLSKGTNVLAVAAGTVFLAQAVSDSRGPYIVGIDHGGNFATEYWHLSSITSSIKVGVSVTQGTILAQSGAPVNPPGPAHLHLEFRTGSPSYLTPLSARGMPIDGYKIWPYAASTSQGYNYQGTMTRGTTINKSINACNATGVTAWYSQNGSTVIAASNGKGGYLTSSNSTGNQSTGHFQFSPSSVSVTVASGQNPSPQILTMTNGGTGTLMWNFTSSLPSWLAFNSTSGSLTPGGSAIITLTFNLPASPGTYSTSLVFSAPNTDNSPASVPVTATVTPIGHFQISPSTVNVTAVSGQNPSPQTLTMTNSGNGTLAWNLSSTLPSWLAVSPLSDSLAPGASEAITLTFSLSSTPGTSSTTLVFSAANTDNSPATVAVAATVVGWGVVSSPNDGSGGNRLFGVAAVSANDIWSVGNSANGPLIEHYDGTSWNIISGPSNGILTQVASVSASDVWAVGFSGNPSQTLIEHYDGTSWSVVSSPSPGTRVNELTGIAATSASDIWSVGYDIGSDGSEQTLIEHYDGTSWSVVTSPDPGTGINQLSGVVAIAPNDAWSVGEYTASYGGVPQPLIEQYNGTSWSVVTSPTVGSGKDPYELLNVAAASANDVWAVGSNFNSSSVSPVPTLIEHFDGTNWSIVPSPTIGTGGYLQAIAVNSTSDVWAVGFSSNGTADQTLIEHFDGTSWSVVSSPNIGTGNNALYGVADISAGDVWAVGYSGNSSNIDQTLIENYN